MIRLCLVEDDARYRAALEELFSHTDDFELVEQFEDGERALRRVRRLVEQGEAAPWELVLMDLEMPGVGGIETTRRFKQLFPDVSIVVHTVFESPGVIVEAISAGADGYLLKKSSARELLAQLRSIASGGAPLTASVARSVLAVMRRYAPDDRKKAPSRQSLTDREQDVLRCFVRGMSYAETADHLGIALDTVRNYVRTTYRKLQVHSVAEAVSRAIQDGLV